MYPVDVKKKLLIKLNAQNSGDVYADNKVDVDLHEYSYSWIKGEVTLFSINNTYLDIDFSAAGLIFQHSAYCKFKSLTFHQ